MLTLNVPQVKQARLARVLRPRIVAVFSFRYDAHLVPDLIANLEPIVDGWVSWDDRQAASAFTGDTERRKRLIQAAHDAGAQWVLAVDPDERFEAATAQRIRWMTRVPGRICWSFNLRELYDPACYRIDGVWGRKRQKRLFRIFDDQFPVATRGSFESRPLHDAWVPPGYRTLHSGLNLYHLKMIAPERRRARSRLYGTLDPEGRYQKIGYDYLADEDGATFEAIPAGRGYRPPHVDDGGLWMADPDELRR